MTNKQFIENIAAAVKKFGPKYGICVASPIIAQACLESGYGTSNKAKYNNFFGLKYRENRVPISNGYIVDTSFEQKADGSYVKISTKWFKFATLEDGVEGYFQFINNDNYANLKGVTDPLTYLQNIKADGYATSLKYVDNLMAVIESNDLTKYDKDDKFRVHIDPGHYGSKYNKSNTGLDYYESKMTWTLSGYLKEELEKLGAEVTLSRTKIDEDPSLYDRGYGAKGKNLFLSIHSNAASNESADYPLVIRGVNKTEAEEFGLKLAQLIQELMATKQKGKTMTKASSGDRNGNGTKGDDEYYGVLHGASMAGLVYYYIVEHSFHTNYNATKWLCSDSNLKTLAKKEAELIADYFGFKKEEEKQETTTEIYRVRKSWEDKDSQLGAYSVLDNAKKACKDGYSVYDSKGNKVYPEEPETITYTIMSGDTLTKIADLYNTTVEVLKKLNNIINTSLIKAKQKIKVPDTKKTNEQIAKEVIQGKWGSGTARKKALEEAGYNYSEVQAIVNKLCK